MNNTLTPNNPLSDSDWAKIFDAEFEKTDCIFFTILSGKRVYFIRADVLNKIRAEVEQLPNANPSYWHSGDIVSRADVLEIIDKYKTEWEVKE